MSERRKKLLLADDSVTIQKVVNLTFADEGIEVLAVGDGDAAVEKFAEFAPDLLMVDVNMPGMDGYSICELVKRDAATARIPVILLVGSFETFDEERAYQVGADGYLTKPFQSIRQLVGKVTALLDSANADVSNGAPNFNEATAAGANGEKEESAPTFQNHDTEIYDAEFYEQAEDKTIQTNQIGSLPVDEAQRFSSAAAGSGNSDYSQTSAAEPFENSYQFETEVETGGDGEIVSSASPSPGFDWDFDDFDLLELPNYSAPAALRETEKTTSETEPRLATEEPPRAADISPELIEQIAAKVVAKLSEQVIAQMKRQIVPQMSDLIVKELSAMDGK